MLDVRPRPARLPEPSQLQAVLVTSAAALPSLPQAFHPLPLLAVGDATAASAASVGFADVASAGADAAALLALAIRRCRKEAGPLLLASSVGQGVRLAADLRANGFRVHRRAVYAARPVAALPQTARDSLLERALTAALFFSPATGRAFVRAVRGELSGTVSDVEAIAISAATAQAIAPLPWRRIRVASRPNQDELLVLLR